MANMTPMMRQYLEMKDKYPGMILFFRLGDFYEMFFDDAKLVSRELELTLTGKSCGMEERAPMCGVPFHSAETAGIAFSVCCASSISWLKRTISSALPALIAVCMPSFASRYRLIAAATAGSFIAVFSVICMALYSSESTIA